MLVDTGELGMNGGFWTRKTGADFSQWRYPLSGLVYSSAATDPWLQMPPHGCKHCRTGSWGSEDLVNILIMLKKKIFRSGQTLAKPWPLFHSDFPLFLKPFRGDGLCLPTFAGLFWLAASSPL